MNSLQKEQIREIKFRAWDKRTKKVLTKNAIIGMKGEVYLNVDGNLFEYKDDRDRIVLMQFTGLKDKNGKEIFEGDIVEFINSISKGKRIVSIDFRNGQYWLIEMGGALTLLNPAQELKVIGNIYENPELLEEK